MREDMFEVLVERPRLHGTRRLPHRRRRQASRRADPADLPAREGMSPHRFGDKDLNENLAPLRRFLERRVGRAWNAVYGEIRRAIDGRSAVQLHILQHLDGFVHRYVRLVDGALIDGCPGCWARRGRPLGDGDLYVCPSSGRLERARVPRPRPPAPRIEAVRIGGDEYRLVDGHWYRIAFSTLSPERPEGFDLVARERVTLDPRSPRGPARYVSEKRQCGRKELRAIARRIGR